MSIARALILADAHAEHGPWAAAPEGPKHLFPIANRPILFHNLEALRSAGVREAAILANGATREAIALAAGDGRQLGVSLHYSEWEATGGLGQALDISREFLGDEPVLVQQGDALLRERITPHIAAFARERLDTLALRLETADGVRRLPAPGYLLSPRAVSILLDSPRDRANPVSGVRAMGGHVRIQRVDGCLPCHGDHDTVLDGNRRMLEHLESDYDPRSLEACTVQGPVVVHPTARVYRTLLRGPAIIGAGARISDAYVGPYTSIGGDVCIEGSQIEYSIVLAGAELRFIGVRLESSVIGRGARIQRGFELPGAMRMAVGAGSEVILT